MIFNPMRIYNTVYIKEDRDAENCVFMNHLGGAEPIAKSCSPVAQAHQEMSPFRVSFILMINMYIGIQNSRRVTWSQFKLIEYSTLCLFVLNPCCQICLVLLIWIYEHFSVYPITSSSARMVTGVCNFVLCQRSISLSFWHWAVNGSAVPDFSTVLSQNVGAAATGYIYIQHFFLLWMLMTCLSWYSIIIKSKHVWQDLNFVHECKSWKQM